MTAGGGLDLNPEEQAFFDAGDASPAPSPDDHPTIRRHRSRRRSRRHVVRRLRHKLSSRGWRRLSLSVVLTIVAIGAGYWVSMYVIGRDLPDPSEFGVQTRGR
jgi:hypothetical protein